MPRVFTVGTLLVGALAAYVVGFSKTALPGAALVAVPLFAMVFEGRQIPGGTLPVLICADLFAVSWYRHHARWDVLTPLAPWLALGYGFGIAFFVAIGAATRSLEVTIGLIVLFIVGVQIVRIARGQPARPADTVTAATYGTTGGFTTFVANAAGPVVNTYLVGVGLPKAPMIGTSAWLYFIVNVSKIPLYIAIGAWTDGGWFFTADSLLFDLAVVPGVFAGVYSGRALFPHIPQRTFLILVLALSVAGAVKLVI